MSRCKAFVYAGVEDFGIAPVEAMASGSPIIAFGKGGILDSVNCLSKSKPNQLSNGILFRRQTATDIIDTIGWFEDKKIWKKFNPQDLNNHAKNFSSKNFKTKFEISIGKALEKFKKKIK